MIKAERDRAKRKADEEKKKEEEKAKKEAKKDKKKKKKDKENAESEKEEEVKPDSEEPPGIQSSIHVSPSYPYDAPLSELLSILAPSSPKSFRQRG